MILSSDASWLDSWQEATQCPESFGALCFGKIPFGFISADRAVVLSASGLLRREQNRFVMLESENSITRSEILARAGEVLCQHGLAPHPSGEALDLFALTTASPLHTSGKPLCCIDRAFSRAFGALTSVVHLTAFNAEGFVLGRRSATKRIGPGLWDSLAAGMVRSGETPEETLIREAKEEAGILLDELHDIQALPLRLRFQELPGEGCLLERTYPFATQLPENLLLRPRPKEVDCFATFSLREVHQLLAVGGIMGEAAASIEECFRSCLGPRY